MKEKTCNCCRKKITIAFFRCVKCGKLVCGSCMMRSQALQCIFCKTGRYVREVIGTEATRA